MNNIPYFQIYAVDFLTLTQKLSEREVFLILTAISELCLYGKTEIKIENFYSKIFYEKILKDLEKNKKKYLASVRNGKKGGRPSNNPQVSTGLNQTEPKQNLDRNQQKQKQNNKQKQKISTNVDTECEQCVNFLAMIVKTKKNINPHTAKWKDDIDKLNRLDGVSWDRIIKALQWYQDNIGGAYIPVIESGASLREKFTKLENAMSRSQNVTNPKKDNLAKTDEAIRKFLNKSGE